MSPIENGTVKRDDKTTFRATRWADGSITDQDNRPVNGNSFTPDRRTVSGQCGIANSLSGLAPDRIHSWHSGCAGLVVQPRPGGQVQVAFCGCSCGHLDGYRCHDCASRLPLLPTHAGLDSGENAIDPRTGSCVDRVACAEIAVQRQQQRTELREHLLAAREASRNAQSQKRRGMPRKPKSEPTEPKPPKVKKEGRCQHCGQPTKSGQFLPGHDAKLKSQLISVYADREAKATLRVEALAEAIARSWLKYRSGHDNPVLLKGLKTDEEKAAAVSEWDSLVAQADEKLNKGDVSVFLAHRVKARIGG